MATTLGRVSSQMRISIIAEAAVQSDVPPDVRVIGDTTGLLQLPDDFPAFQA
jgi:hypothetical protein